MLRLTNWLIFNLHVVVSRIYCRFTFDLRIRRKKRFSYLKFCLMLFLYLYPRFVLISEVLFLRIVGTIECVSDSNKVRKFEASD